MEFSLSELETFSKGTEVFMAILDGKGTTKKINGKWASRLKYSQHELMGVPLSNFMHSGDRDLFNTVLSSLPSQGFHCHHISRFIDSKLQSFSIQFDLNLKNDEIYLVGFDVSDHDKEHRSLQEMSELAKIGAWYHDPIRDETFWSEEVYRIHDLELGVPMNGEKALSFYSFDDREAINDCVERLYKHHQEYDFSGEIVTATGERKWIRTQAKPTVHNGQVIFIYGVTADQSRLKGNLKKLESYGETQAMALKGIKSGLFDYNVQKDTVFFSDSFQEMLGLSTDEESLSNYDFMDMIHPDDKEEAIQRLRESLKSEENYYFNRYRIRHKNGKYKYYEVYGWIKITDEKATRMVGNLINVDKKIKIQQERVRILNSLEAMVNNGFIYSILLDAKGSILMADNGTLEIIKHDYNVNPLDQKTHFMDVMPDIFKKTFLIEMEKVLKGEIVRKEIERPMLDGSMSWLDMMYRPIKNDTNEIVFILINLADVTKHKRAELAISESEQHAQSLNRLKSGILSNLSHEIRTPLNGIMGATELLSNLDLEEEGKELLEMQRESSMRLMRTLTDMVALSDIDSMRDNMELVSISLNDIIQICFEMYHHQANMKHLTFEVSKCEDDPVALVDKEMIISALGAIVNNALKYTEKGSVMISCHLDEQEYAEIKVKDTGVGIEESNYERIFEDFEKDNAGLNYKYEGTGIGLSISKKFIQLMGGKIYVVSTVGVGSEFSIIIPASKKTQITKRAK